MSRSRRRCRSAAETAAYWAYRTGLAEARLEAARRGTHAPGATPTATPTATPGTVALVVATRAESPVHEEASFPFDSGARCERPVVVAAGTRATVEDLARAIEASLALAPVTPTSRVALVLARGHGPRWTCTMPYAHSRFLGEAAADPAARDERVQAVAAAFHNCIRPQAPTTVPAPPTVDTPEARG